MSANGRESTNTAEHVSLSIYTINRNYACAHDIPFNKKKKPEWVGWTVTGPSPAEGHLPWPGVLFVGELAQVPHYPERRHPEWLSPPKLTLRGQAGSTYTRIRIQRQLALPGL